MENTPHSKTREHKKPFRKFKNHQQEEDDEAELMEEEETGNAERRSDDQEDLSDEYPQEKDSDSY